MVDLDKDAGAELDGLGGVVQGIDGQGAAADAVRLFKDGDVDGQLLLGGEALQVVRCRGPGRAGACMSTLVAPFADG